MSTTNGLSTEKKQTISQSVRPEVDLTPVEEESSRIDYAVSSSAQETSPAQEQPAEQTEETSAETAQTASEETEPVEEAQASQEETQAQVTEETPAQEETPAESQPEETQGNASEPVQEEIPAETSEETPAEEAPAEESAPEQTEESAQSASTEENPGTTDRGQETSGGSTTGGYTDLDYLAALCQIEAGPYYDGSLAVANCVLNRLYAGFGSSIYDIIYAPYQFACGNIMYLLDTGSVSSVCYEAAQDALNGVNNIGGYLYFNGTTWLDPATLDCPYVVIGGNCFY